MNIVLLSGGSGKRLWPLSNDVRSKQFIKFFKSEDGYKSMIQRMYSQIKFVDPDANVTIATSKSQVSSIYNQLNDNVSVSVEPCRRDTFAAIALATAYLHDVKKVDKDEAVVVCPVDPYVGRKYFETLNQLYLQASKGVSNLILMGIKPTYPSEKYGYIKIEIGCSKKKYSFTEKPSKDKAEEYIKNGALWNGGVFAYKLNYVLEKSRELLGTSDYDELLKNYSKLNKISFDYAVVEQENSIDVVQYDGEWKDLGTWNTLTEALDDKTIGNVTLSDDCENVHVINELNIPVIAMGMSNVVIGASPDGILVSDKNKSSYIKPYVEKVSSQVMYADKSWGTYRVLFVGPESMTILVSLNHGEKMNYHSHERRSEVWNVINGSGTVVINGEIKSVKCGDVIPLPIGSKHTVKAGEEGIQLIEVQFGKDIDVTDKMKFDLSF